jgi:MFS family permease
METNEATSPVRSKKVNIDFWKYWSGQTISNLGSSITLFALPLLVYKLTGSALNLGIATAANYIPYLLFGLLLGAWMDRVNRKRTMLLTDLARAAIIISIPLAASFGILTVWWIYYIVGFVHSTLTLCFETGEFAAITRLVDQDDLVTANGRIQASYSGASIVGPLLAGALITIMPASTLMYFDALSFVISAGSLALIKKNFNGTTSEIASNTHIVQDVIEGLRYVLNQPILRNISLMMALVNFIATTRNSQLIFFAKEQLHASDAQVSVLYAAGSIGIVVLSLIAGPLRKRWSFSTVALGALMSSGLFTIILAFTHLYWIAVILLAIISGLGILFNINTSSLRQSLVPDRLLSRVISVASVLAWSAIPLGSLAGGAVITWTGNIELVYASIGMLVFLIPLVFAFTALGHADRYLPHTKDA